MKIEAFIARLNGDFIGFYCLNLFKFTKLAFFQFFYALTTVYILINGINRNIKWNNYQDGVVIY